jgi:hypothetical protein
MGSVGVDKHEDPFHLLSGLDGSSRREQRRCWGAETPDRVVDRGPRVAQHDLGVPTVGLGTHLLPVRRSPRNTTRSASESPSIDAPQAADSGPPRAAVQPPPRSSILDGLVRPSPLGPPDGPPIPDNRGRAGRSRTRPGDDIDLSTGDRPLRDHRHRPLTTTADDLDDRRAQPLTAAQNAASPGRPGMRQSVHERSSGDEGAEPPVDDCSCGRRTIAPWSQWSGADVATHHPAPLGDPAVTGEAQLLEQVLRAGMEVVPALRLCGPRPARGKPL